MTGGSKRSIPEAAIARMKKAREARPNFGTVSEETMMEHYLLLPKGLQPAARKILASIGNLEKPRLEMDREVREKSPALADAHENEILALREEAIRRLQVAGKETDAKARREKVKDALEELGEMNERAGSGQTCRREMLQTGVEPSKAEKLDANMDFLVEGVERGKVEEAAKELGVLKVTSPTSAEFVEAYSLLSRFFPTDEIDPPKMLMDFMQETSEGKVTTNAQGKAEYSRYFVAIVKNGKGEAIGAADGTFSAGEDGNGLYLSHIAVLPEFRRTQVATLLETAMITECDKYAREAEQALGVSYPEGAQRNKIMHMMLETEFPSLRPSEVKATFGRLLFHGVNGFAVISPERMRYLQPDTTWEEGKNYDSAEWKSVPLYFAIRGIGREVTGKDAKELLRLMYNGFVQMGMNEQGVEADWKYATEKLGDDAAGVRLPRNSEELQKFIFSFGDWASILKRHYEKCNWSRDYLADSEEPLGITQALELFNKGSREPPRDI